MYVPCDSKYVPCDSKYVPFDSKYVPCGSEYVPCGSICPMCSVPISSEIRSFTPNSEFFRNSLRIYSEIRSIFEKERQRGTIERETERERERRWYCTKERSVADKSNALELFRYVSLNITRWQMCDIPTKIISSVSEDDLWKLQSMFCQTANNNMNLILWKV